MEWRDIPGLEGLYKISEFGHVKSCERYIESKRWPSKKKLVRERILKVSWWNGFSFVTISHGGKRLKFKIHQLVARVFVGPRPSVAIVRHLDGTPSRNHFTNLVYGTQAEVIADSIVRGTFTRGGKNGAAKLTNSQAAEIKARLRSGERTKPIADHYHMSWQAICDIKAGRSWAHIKKEVA